MSVTGEKAQDQHEQISVDGGWFAVVDGGWRQVPNPNSPVRTAAASSMPVGEFEQGPVSVDGGWFAVVDGEWKNVGYANSGAARPRRAIPEGYVLVDGALFPVEQR